MQFLLHVSTAGLQPMLQTKLNERPEQLLSSWDVSPVPTPTMTAHLCSAATQCETGRPEGAENGSIQLRSDGHGRVCRAKGPTFTNRTVGKLLSRGSRQILSRSTWMQRATLLLWGQKFQPTRARVRLSRGATFVFSNSRQEPVVQSRQYAFQDVSTQLSVMHKSHTHSSGPLTPPHAICPKTRFGRRSFTRKQLCAS